MYQDIIAAQAPKLNMFSGFWQLVLDQNITAIGTIESAMWLLSLQDYILLMFSHDHQACGGWEEEGGPVLALRGGKEACDGQQDQCQVHE